MKRLILTGAWTFVLAVWFVPRTQGQEQVIFKGSDRINYYDPSWGFAVPPSFLELQNEKLPVDTGRTYAGNNVLRLHWISKQGGEWGVAIASAGWIPFDVTLKDSLSFMVYAETAIRSSDLPVLYLEDIRNWKTRSLKLSDLLSDIPARQWAKVRIPLQTLQRISQGADLSRVKSVFFGQNAADGGEHTLYVDDLKAFGGSWLARYRFIVVLGSSTAFGTGADNLDSTWVNRFNHYVQRIDSTYRVINLAVAGYSTYRIMPNEFHPPSARAPSDLGKNISTAMEYNPRAIIINVSSDDVAYGYSIAEQITNYDALFAFAEKHGVPLWITTPQPRNFSSIELRRQLSSVRDALLNRYSGTRNPVIDFWSGIADSTGGIRSEYDSGDGVHVNNAGHGILSGRVESAKVAEVFAR